MGNRGSAVRLLPPDNDNPQMRGDTYAKVRARLYPLRPHSVQAQLWQANTLFNVVPAGRRSGKTEIVGKRRIVLRCLQPKPWLDPRYFVAAPTRDQAKKIYWSDLKLISRPYWERTPSESSLIIYLKPGIELHVLGMDKPERVEGPPWDGGVLDEYGNMKKNVWTEHVQPALADRDGWCDFIGVPEGRNHYYDLYKEAQAAETDMGEESEWRVFHWTSETVLAPHQIERAKRDLDELSYQQEYLASFISFKGRAYYNFFDDSHCANLIRYYNPKKALIFCFDFNVDPGVAVVCQEMMPLDPSTKLPIVGSGYSMTGVIGEVHIPQNSNTPMVCNKLVEDWKDHDGPIRVYGDATGGNRGSAAVQGSDWDLVRNILKNGFRDRIVQFKVPSKNPPERSRVNAVNSRLRSLSGEVKMMVDPIKVPKTVIDLEGVRVVEGGSGEIDKSDLKLTHLSDGLGYYIVAEYPVKKLVATSIRV